MKGSGPTQGINGAFVVTINQPIRDLMSQGVNTDIAPTVTFFVCVRAQLAPQGASQGSHLGGPALAPSGPPSNVVA
jgi:hypothetical protein